MCGIAGYVGENQNNGRALSRMNSIQSHRGPDFSAHISDSWFALGHCRLSIIDLSNSSNQPVKDEDFLLAYNGEIYNWKELRIEFKIPTNVVNSDTQMLFFLLKKLGIIETIRIIRGIYAFVFVDKRKKQVHLVRDRFGTKPLYIYRNKKEYYFASEIKAFTVLDSWRPKLNQNSLQSYLTFQNNFTSGTLFENVELIPQNSYATISFNEYPSLTFQEFSRNKALHEHKKSPETLESLEFLLKQSIARNLTSDVEIGSFLSGGIDSTLIANYASKYLPNLRTFTVGFDLEGANIFENNFDETAIASQVSNYLGTLHKSKTITSGLLAEVIDQVSYAIEDPRVGQSYPNYFAARLAALDVSVCLSGAGGDEIFAGYPWRYAPVLNQANAFDKSKMLFNFWHRLGDPNSIANILNLTVEDHLAKHISEFRAVFEKNNISIEEGLTLKGILKFEQATFLHGLLQVEDKLSMLHSLEVRVPYLDEDLVNFAECLPDSLLMKHIPVSLLNENELSNTLYKEELKRSGKIALRQIADDVLPLSSKLQKQGFSAPDATWFKNDHEKLLKTRLYNRDSVLWENLNYESAIAKVNDHRNGKANNRLLIWSLLTLESTIRQYNLT